MSYQGKCIKFLFQERKKYRCPPVCHKGPIYIDCARPTGYDLANLSESELYEASFFLVKNLRKSDNKSDHSHAKIIPFSNKKSMLVIDFLVSAKKFHCCFSPETSLYDTKSWQ